MMQVLLGDDENEGSFYWDVLTVPTFTVPNTSHKMPPEGATIILDQYKAYYRTLHPGQAPDPDQIIVAIDSVPI